MKIDVCMRVNDIEEDKLTGSAAVVFDVLRATSTIVTALANGCRGVLPVAEVDEARVMAARMRQKGLPVILGGERGGRKLPDFDGGNSPLEYTAGVAGGKLLVLTTTNGTRTIQACSTAAKIYAGSFINAGAVARRLIDDGLDAVLVCAGTKGKFSLEDAAAAGLVAYNLVQLASQENNAPAIEMTDAAAAMSRFASSYSQSMLHCLYDSKHGKKLLKLGFENDLVWCGHPDRYNLVPQLDKQKWQMIL